MKTITELRPLLVGELLARAERRARRKAGRRAFWRTLLGLDRGPRLHTGRLGARELVIAEGRQ